MRSLSMGLRIPCNSSLRTSTFFSKPHFPQYLPPTASSASPWSYKRSRRAVRVELGTQVAKSEYNGSYSPSTMPIHKVTVHDRQRGVTHVFLVPEDQYILHTAEAQNIALPFACRRIYGTTIGLNSKQFNIYKGCHLKDSRTVVQFGFYPIPCVLKCSSSFQGYALLCVGFPSSDIEVETQDEDEVYWLQFGRYFARGPVERDDYALELAMADE